MMAAERVQCSRIVDQPRTGLVRRWRRYGTDLRDVPTLQHHGWQIAAPWHRRVENQRIKLVEMVRFPRFWGHFDLYQQPKEHFLRAWKDQTVRNLVIQKFIRDANSLERMMAAVTAPRRPKL